MLMHNIALAHTAMNGDELTPWLIRYGYEQGAFPMTTQEGAIEWFQPTRRALFPMSGIRVSSSMRKVLRRGGFEITFDQAFEQVMRGCLRPDENWISEEMIRVYTQIHHLGWAHSCEVWSIPGTPSPFSGCIVPANGEGAGGGERSLVGGLYGLALGTCFCAESMFHRRTNASKVALKATVEKCRSLGFTLFDAQVMNPHLASMGAFEVTNAHYMGLLKAALRGKTAWSGR